MGKRKKSSKPVQRAPAAKLDTTFDCPFCNHAKSVEARMERTSVPPRGTLRCGVCGASHQCEINALSEPIDVYGDWIDLIEEVNQ